MTKASNIEVMLSAEVLADKVRELGKRIIEDYAGKQLTVVGVLNGSFMFMADLVRAIDLDMRCDFLGLSSYGEKTHTSGVVAITKDLSGSIEGHDVLVVEDIIDTGLTMDYLIENLSTRHPNSIKIASLLSKPARRRVETPIEYLGFSIEDRFVVGYGLDYAGHYRNLPYIGVVTP